MKQFQIAIIPKLFEEKDLIQIEIEIVGLYDPEENDLTIDMWSNSNGEDIFRIFNKLKKLNYRMILKKY